MTRDEIKPGALIARTAHIERNERRFIVTRLVPDLESRRRGLDFDMVIMMSLDTGEIESRYAYILEDYFSLVAAAAPGNDT